MGWVGSGHTKWTLGQLWFGQTCATRPRFFCPFCRTLADNSTKEVVPFETFVSHRQLTDKRRAMPIDLFNCLKPSPTQPNPLKLLPGHIQPNNPSWFLPRELLSQVFISVRLSVTSWCCIRMADSITQTTPHDSPGTLATQLSDVKDRLWDLNVVIQRL